MAVPLAWAAAIGFMSGMVVVYLLSIRWAFKNRNVRDRRLELIIFVIVGLAGLVITEFMLHMLSSEFGLPVSKFVTAIVVFSFNFSMRKLLLFTRTD